MASPPSDPEVLRAIESLQRLAELFGERRLRLIREADGLGPALAHSRKGKPLWGYLLLAALLLRFFEGFFANRIAVARSEREEAES